MTHCVRGRLQVVIVGVCCLSKRFTWAVSPTSAVVLSHLRRSVLCLINCTKGALLAPLRTPFFLPHPPPLGVGHLRHPPPPGDGHLRLLPLPGDGHLLLRAGLLRRTLNHLVRPPDHLALVLTAARRLQHLALTQPSSLVLRFRQRALVHRREMASVLAHPGVTPVKMDMERVIKLVLERVLEQAKEGREQLLVNQELLAHPTTHKGRRPAVVVVGASRASSLVLSSLSSSSWPFCCFYGGAERGRDARAWQFPTGRRSLHRTTGRP